MKDNLYEVKASELNFEHTYQPKPPPEADELEALVKTFNNKENDKTKEIEKYKKNADEKYRKMKNLVPESKINISSLRMEEFEDGQGAAERRNKSLLRALNMRKAAAPTSNAKASDNPIQALKAQI